MGTIAKNWKDLSGENNWKGLLSPLNLDLRRYLIHYGERVAAAEYAFNYRKASKGYGYSLYPPEYFFTNLWLQNGNPYKYVVTSFFYALEETKEDRKSVWMGYVAVTTDEGKNVLGRRDILVCWRGTMTQSEWEKDVESDLVAAKDLLGKGDNPKVHSGFYSIYTASSEDTPFSKISARDQILEEVKKQMEKYKDEEISISVSGISLGASLATLTAIDIVANGYNTKPVGGTCMVTALAFASPRIGDAGLKKMFSGLDNLHILRVTDMLDNVPSYPPLEWGYVDLGEELKINTTKSHYLKPDIPVHVLDVYLHGIAGWQENGEFMLVVDHDISLVNRILDGLKDEYGVPAEWWCNERNNNMVQMDDGSWKMNDYVPDPPSVNSIHLPEKFSLKTTNAFAKYFKLFRYMLLRRVLLFCSP